MAVATMSATTYEFSMKKMLCHLKQKQKTKQKKKKTLAN